MAENSVMLNSFTLFPTLPEELRTQIFKEAIYQNPRIIEICQKPQEFEEQPQINKPETELNVENLSLINEAASPDQVASKSKSDSDSSSSSASLDQETEEDDEEEAPPYPPNPNAFYTCTPPPALLHTSREARSVALLYYKLSFPNPDGSQPPKIYANLSIDTLYFPTWAFPANNYDFTSILSASVKSTIRRVAIDNLMWFSSWDEGCINFTFRISEFKNLEELVLVERAEGSACGCCTEPDRPDQGVVGFMEVPQKRYQTKCLEECRTEFVRCKDRDDEWNVPTVRCVGLMRGGKPCQLGSEQHTA